jgi:hypothetical protein
MKSFYKQAVAAVHVKKRNTRVSGNVLHELNRATKGGIVQGRDHVLSVSPECNVSIVMLVQERVVF